jgi:hypothetical protein
MIVLQQVVPDCGPERNLASDVSQTLCAQPPSSSLSLLRALRQPPALHLLPLRQHPAPVAPHLHHLAKFQQAAMGLHHLHQLALGRTASGCASHPSACTAKL